MTFILLSCKKGSYCDDGRAIKIDRVFLYRCITAFVTVIGDYVQDCPLYYKLLTFERD